jgi:hypothetical protein
MISKYGNNRDLEDAPSSATAKPAIIFKPHSSKKQLVPYDVNKALQLLARRDPLPPVFSSASDAVDIPQGMLGRDKPLFKPRNIVEAMRASKNDEG